MKTSSLVPPLQPGMFVRVRAIYPYPLPRGLAAGAEVIVVRIDDGTCLVRDHSGQEWSVAAVSLDPGYMVWMDGHWVPEIQSGAA